MKKNLVAVVLAGGAGSRFWPFLTNKVLWPFFDTTFLAHVLVDRLPREVTKVVLVASPANAETLRALKLSVPTSVIVQEEARGMADALLAARTDLAGNSLLVINGDDIFDKTLYAQILRLAKQSDVAGVIPGWKTPTHFVGGYLKLDGERVVQIVEKPEAGTEPSPWVNVVAHYIADADMLLTTMEKTTSSVDDVYEQALTSLMTTGKFVVAPYEGPFASLKYPWHILEVMEYIFADLPSHKGKNVTIKSNVVIEGPVFIDDGVKIFENTKIVGPCYIGKNTIIGNNNIIRDSYIGDNCVTGFATDITRSYIGNGCWFHTNYIGDSVLEGNVSMGSGAVLANLRLDDGTISSAVKNEKIMTHKNKLGAMIATGVRIGVNASIMPGVKIGHDSFIGSAALVDRDVPDESFLLTSANYELKSNTKKAAADRDAFKSKI